MVGIRIREEKVLPLGRFFQLVFGVDLSLPTFRQRPSAYFPDPAVLLGEPVDNCAGPVAGVVVQHQDFQWRIALAEKGTDAFLDDCFLVAGRDADAYRGVPCKRLLGQLVQVTHPQDVGQGKQERVYSHYQDNPRKHKHGRLLGVGLLVQTPNDISFGDRFLRLEILYFAVIDLVNIFERTVE